MFALRRTQRWVKDVVIGLNLCPWAKDIFDDGTLKFELGHAATPETAHFEFLSELEELLQDPLRKSTLLVFERWVIPFPVFWDVVGAFEDELSSLGLDAQFQLVAFHPEFRFEGVKKGSRAHWVNRSPYPTLHFLRSADIERASKQNLAMAEGLSARNEKVLARLSDAQVRALFPYLYE